MTQEKRRILTNEEKADLLAKHPTCYICNEPLANYDQSEIQFDHIYNYADGYPQELFNFAPVHASKDLRKRNCHGSKGKKSPVEYREELRIKGALSGISGLKDLCPHAVPSVYSVANDFRSITFNGITLPLYNQRIGNKDNYYFFHEVEIKYIENDEQIQLRPLEDKIIGLIFNLKQAVQLLPSLGRLDSTSKTVKIFDGQHKAVAQIIGNNRDRIPCIVFVHPDVNELRVVIYQAHTDFVQQRYKKSHIDAKLAHIFAQRIETYRKQMGDPTAAYSEATILHGESRAQVREYIIGWLIEAVKDQSSFIDTYVADSRTAQKVRPILWQSLERMVRVFCKIDAVTVPSTDPRNYRAPEIENFRYILDLLEKYSLLNKWDANNPEAKTHQLSRTFYYRTAFNNWIDVLYEAMKYALEQMRGRKINDELCYAEEFSPQVKERFDQIAERLFTHPMWVHENIQREIATANQDAVVGAIFEREGLDYIYLTKFS
jgi:hypothetical protein